MWKLIENKDWATLEQQFSWVADMKYVKQHNRHHAEGSVDIHTQMVLDALTKSNNYKLLPEQQQEIIWAAALMHDIEKRSTSIDMGNGRISADGHARKGEYTVRSVLYKDISTPFYIREQIASLVRHHGFPLWFLEKENPLKKVIEVSLRTDTQLLKYLSEADIKGRICDDGNSLLESLEYFEIFCKENDCWAKAKEFKTLAARFHYLNSENSYIDYIPFEDFRCKVTLLSALPGMGKDHYLQNIDKDIPVVSLDAIRRKYKILPTDKSGNGRVIQEAKETAREYLRKNQDFIWNATNITRQIRTQLIDLFAEYGAKTEIIYIEKPYKIWRKQNREREYALPEDVLDKMLQKLEIPQLSEAHEIKYIVDDNEK
jgi:predicted kinase